MRKSTTAAIALLCLMMAIGIRVSYEQPHPAAPRTLGNLSDLPEMVLPLPMDWTGDFDGMQERRLIRILTPYTRTNYTIDRGRERGLVHDMGRQFESWLNRKYRLDSRPIRIIFIPTPRDRLLPDLIQGRGDIATGDLTVTPARKAIIDFTPTGTSGVNEIIVTGPTAPPLATMEELSQTTIYVRRSSSYFEHLVTLDRERGLGLNIKPADENLEDEDLLKMVDAGLLPLTVVDDHKARIWAEVYTNITLRDDLAVHRDGRIAWAVRKGSPLLLSELEKFSHEEGLRNGLFNIFNERYFGSAKYLKKVASETSLARYDELVKHFQTYGAKYGFEPLVLMAQGYQESRLRQNVTSPAGAVGVMQVLPDTARIEEVAIPDIKTNVENNIHAGVKYLRYLIDTFVTEEDMNEIDRLLLGFAAYNAGPLNLRKMRARAAQAGLNPNVWFDNVEVGAAQVIGRETVRYVSNIYKYYIAYKLARDREMVLEARRQAINEGQAK